MLPIHYALIYGCTLEVLVALLYEYPDGAALEVESETAIEYNRKIAIEIAMDKKASIEIVVALFIAFPDYGLMMDCDPMYYDVIGIYSRFMTLCKVPLLEGCLLVDRNLIFLYMRNIISIFFIFSHSVHFSNKNIHHL
jgi:hypothetical protein